MTPSRGVYGAPRIHAELRLEHGIRVGRKRVARLMKAAGISGVRPRKRWKTTIRITGITPATDLVERQFRPTSPNVVWVADITYLRTGEGWTPAADRCERLPWFTRVGRARGAGAQPESPAPRREEA
jgi:transposase InsO family protein